MSKKTKTTSLEKQEKKNRLIEEIIDNLESNIYDSKEYIFALCRESLSKRTLKELKEIHA